MKSVKKKKYFSWILLGIPVLFIVGAAFHFIYELSGSLAIVGSIAPVNESIWEHTKLALVPMLCWWLLWYAIKGKEYEINRNNWFVATLVATVTVPVLIIMFYYTYSGAFNIYSLAVDMTSFFLCISIGQFFGLHVYKYGHFSNKAFIIATILMVLLVLMYICLTFYTPHYPLFMDNNNGLYGLPR